MADHFLSRVALAGCWVKLPGPAQSDVWWLCADRPAAARFAEFVNAEIDPGTVLIDASPDVIPPSWAPVHDPVHELLAWWEQFGRDHPPVNGHNLEGNDPDAQP